MNTLITGGAGFIGTHLTRHLLRLGHELAVLDNFSPQIHGGKTELAPDIKPHVKLIRGDVAEPSVLGPALDWAECVVHLAAETGTGQSMYEVSRYERTNLAGTALIFDLLTKSQAKKVSRIVVASSRAIYGEGAYLCELDGVVYPTPRTAAEKKDGFFDLLCPLCGQPCESILWPHQAGAGADRAHVR
jgi:dTDP-L-rhamnose 4-epimerase